jgi:hypothetical protein
MGVGDRQQWQLLGQRQTPIPDRDHPTHGGPGQSLGHKPGLGDTGIPHHKHQPGRLSQRRLQAGQLPLPADKGPVPAIRPRLVRQHKSEKGSARRGGQDSAGQVRADERAIRGKRVC